MTEEIEMVMCEIDDVEILVEDSIQIGSHTVHKKYEGEWFECEDCEGLFEINYQHNSVYGDRSVCNGCRNDNYTTCEDCGEIVPSDDASYVDNGDYYVCQGCYEDNYFYCDGCGEVYHNDRYGNDGYCENCSSDDDADEKDGVIKSASLPEGIELEDQEEIETPQNVLVWLSNFYGDRHNISRLSKTKDVHLEFGISMETNIAKTKFKEWALGMSMPNVGKEISSTFKYANATNVSNSGPKVSYTIVDNLGNRKEKTENIFTVYNYYKKILGDGFTGTLTAEELAMGEFKMVMSNDYEHKIKLANANGNAFSSCQTKDNRNGYAKGMRDWFNNGCNVPISISLGDEIIGRTLCRLMYDENGKEYLFVDRTYLSSRYSNERIALIQQMIDKLSEHYDLALPNRSEHDSSTYDLYKYNKTEFVPLELGQLSLRQPFRYNNTYIDRAYYHDSNTRTFTTGGNKMYDKILKEKYHILPKK